MPNPMTDIVCLTHNQLAVTRGFLKHLHENTRNFRLIVVDNGSTDGTPDFLDKQVKKSNIDVLVKLPENVGVITGRNIGAQHVVSDFFVNLDNDQYVGLGWLDTLHCFTERGFDIVGKEAWQMIPPLSRGVDTKPGHARRDRSYYPNKRCTHASMRFAYIGCGGMLIRKAVYDDIGLFDERFSPAYFEDPDFCFRAIKAGYQITWHPRCPIKHLAHQTIANQKLFVKNQQFLQSWTRFKEKWDGYFPGLMKRRLKP